MCVYKWKQQRKNANKNWQRFCICKFFRIFFWFFKFKVKNNKNGKLAIKICLFIFWAGFFKLKRFSDFLEEGHRWSLIDCENKQQKNPLRRRENWFLCIKGKNLIEFCLVQIEPNNGRTKVKLDWVIGTLV